MSIASAIVALQPELTAWRHHLHAWPETAYQEFKTAAFVVEKLSAFGLTVEQGIAGTGVVGTLRTDPEGAAAIGLRADMDGLDIQEENAFEHRSRHPGKMHACGHDGHITMLLGAAKLLAERKDFKGTVHFIFQPAEENEGGGGRMVAEGLLERFPMKAIFGLHNFPMLPLGYFATRPGPMMAAFDVFDIIVRGVGSHGAMPHLSCDPLVAAAQMIVQMQSVVSRNVDPGESAVVSVTDIHGGTAYNIIPDKVRLRGTTRHFKPEIQALIEKRLREITSGVAAAAGVSADLTYERRYPAVVNSPEETDIALRVATRVAGADRVIRDLPPLMGSEDFAFFLQKVAGNYIGLGCGDSRPGGMLHQSRYDFNDSLLPIGVAYWCSLVEAVLG